MRKGIYTRIRFLSAVALLLLAVICITAVLLVIINPGLTLLYAIAGVGLVAGGWVMLSAKGRSVWWGVGFTALALIIAVACTWLFFAEPRNARLLLALVGSSVVYIVLAGYITRAYSQMRRVTPRARSLRVTRPALIINPKSGSGRAMKANLADHARAQGIDVVVLRPRQDMVQLAEAAIEQGANIIGISGGDGSLGVMAGVAIRHNLPLVVLPGGTRCHFARDIGLDPARIVEALASFYGTERRVDVGMLGDRVFLNNVSFGLYAEITSRKEYREHKVDTSRRVMRELASSASPFYPLAFHDGTGSAWERAALVLVGVNRYETLHLGEFGERKHLDEGVFQVIALRALDDRALKQLATRKGLRTDEDSPLVEWATNRFMISHPLGWLHVGLDGENVQVLSPAEMRIMPGALRLLVPAEGDRHRRARPLSAAGAKTLWELLLAK